MRLASMKNIQPRCRRIFRLKVGLLIGFLALLSGCDSTSTHSPADIIFTGGSIITMDDQQPLVEAIAISDGKIIRVGSSAEVLNHQTETTELINLDQQALLPGFFDAHSHLSGVGMQSIVANLLPAPDGPVNTIAELQQAMRDYIAHAPTVKAYGVAMGFNYDDSQLQEQRHPNRHELDAISTEIPIVVMHQSGHLGVYNSKAMDMLGINADSPDPNGGIIEREADGRTPSGVMQENAHFKMIYQLVPKFSPEDYVAMMKAGEATYTANGFTTVQEGKADISALNALPTLAEKGVFAIDVVAYADIAALKDLALLDGPLMSRDYQDGFRIAGIKLTFDGSPQGKTAWFTKPYVVPPPGQTDDYAGYPAMTDKQALNWYQLAYQKNWQIMTHTNGDAAIDQLIRTIKAANADAEQQGIANKDRRTVMIHGQFLREDQVADIEALGIFPALYPMHTFYWGDWHRSSVAGPERAENISPTGWLAAKSIPFTIHSDAPVTYPNAMRILDSAVNRTTRSGFILGEQQRIDTYTALKAMTIWPAYQHFEEQQKGSLAVGKLADLVILDKDPLQVPLAELKNIQVMQTIKAGVTVFQRESQ